MDTEESNPFVGCLIGLAAAIVIWGLVIGAAFILAGCARTPEEKRLARCQHAAPPWATGECHG